MLNQTFLKKNLKNGATMNPKNKKPVEKITRNSSRRKKTVSYSKNVFLPVTNFCRNNCTYCSFRQDPENAWIMSREEILKLAKEGKEAGCTEALLTLGEKPEEKYSMIRKKLEEWGYKSTIDYLVGLSREILDIGLLPHTNPGIMSKEEMSRLKKWNASLGLMLESATPLAAHSESPGKKPEKRLEVLENAGKLKIPFTTGILVGIGENWQDRVKSFVKIRELHENYGHIQEVIIQPFIPKEKTPMSNRSKPDHSKILNTVITAKSIMPSVNIQVPPNLVGKITDSLEVGATDIGGISTVTPDFINPDKPWADLSSLESDLSGGGFVLKERLPLHPEYATDSSFMSEEIEEVVNKLIDEKGYRRG